MFSRVAETPLHLRLRGRKLTASMGTKEGEMRTTLFGALVAICVAAMPLASNPAHAMALATPAGMNAAADALSDTQKVW